MGDVARRTGLVGLVGLLVTLVVLAGACSSPAENDDPEIDTAREELRRRTCRTVDVVARRRRGRDLDGDVTLSPVMRFALPGEVQVEPDLGHPGAVLTIHAGGAEVECLYQRVLRRGRFRHNLKSCSDGAREGTTFEASRAEFRIVRGPIHLPFAFAKVTLTELEPCGGVRDASTDVEAGILDAGRDADASDASVEPDASDEDDAGADEDAGAEDAGPACTPESCSDPNPCVTSTCTASGCVSTPRPDGTPCSDGNVCTLEDSCQAGFCISGLPVDSTDDSPCTTDSCDPVLGILHLPVPEGTPCPNATRCDGDEVCSAMGTCLSGVAPGVDDGNVCTIDACDPALGVTHTPRPGGESCTDFDACNGAETCSIAGVCTPGVPPTIDDGNVCTLDSCSPIAGPSHTPIPGCDPTPTGADAPFETRASIIGRVVAKNGTPITNASIKVYDEKATGAPRTDVQAHFAGDGSFRVRLTAFPETEPARSPPHRLVIVFETPATIRAQRVLYAHPGDAEDIGTVRLIGRDPKITVIGAEGGVATDSAGRFEVTVPPGALSAATPIQITPFDEREDFPSPLPDVTFTNYGAEFEPSGTNFASPVTVRVANRANLPTNLSIPVGFYDETEGRWEHVDVARWDGTRFVFHTTHFSPIDCNATLVGELLLLESRGSNPNAGKKVCNVGSSWNSNGGSVSQTISLPATQAGGRSVGVTLQYDSGLAGSRRLGSPPGADGRDAIPHGSLGVSGRSYSAKLTCAAPGGGGGSNSPADCSTSLGPCTAASVDLLAASLGLAARNRALVQTAQNTRELEVGGWVEIPLAGSGAVMGTQLVPQVLEITRGGNVRSSCASSGGVFGVPDVNLPRTPVATPSGAMARIHKKALVHHRISSPYGSGWAIREESRLYADGGDFAVLVDGDGQEEEFRPRARVTEFPSAGLSEDAAFARDDQTGELFVIGFPSGTIVQLDPVSGATTTVATTGLFGRFTGLAVAYVNGSRRFVAANRSAIYEIQGDAPREIAPVTSGVSTYDRSSIATRGSKVYWTTGQAPEPRLFVVDLAAPAAPQALSSAAGDVRLHPRIALGGVQFSRPSGLAFGNDGTLYLGDAGRHVAYAITPQRDGAIGPGSLVTVALGDGAGQYSLAPGNRQPALAFPLNRPSFVSVSEEGIVLVATSLGIVGFDPIAKEAEYLFLDGGRDEILSDLTGVPNSGGIGSPVRPANLVALSSTALIGTTSQTVPSVVRIDVDRLSAEGDPTRTVTRNEQGFTLTDTTQALVQRFDRSGRLVEQRHRTGELQFGVAYLDERSDRIDYIADSAGGRFVFGYENGKLRTITDPAGATTTLDINAQGDLTRIVQPGSETYELHYDGHHMVSKTTPRGETTTYTYAADGTLATSRKPGNENYTFHATLSNPLAYATDGSLSRTGSYTDARGVEHTFKANARGGIDEDSFTADGVTYVRKEVRPAFVGDANGGQNARVSNATLLKSSHTTLNGVNLTAPIQFDVMGRPVLQSRSTTQFSSFDMHRWRYDADGWLRMQVDLPSDNGHWFDRDAAGHVVRVYDAQWQSGINPSGREASFTWRPDGQPATTTVHGVTTTFTYDDAGGTRNLIATSDTLGRTTAMTRDARGNVTSISDGTATNAYEYDARNRLTVARDGLGFASLFRYTHESCGCSEEDLVTAVHTPDLPEGTDWIFGYGAQGRLATITDPHGFKESFTYEPTGEIASHTDRLDRITSVAHDQLGRALELVDIAGRRHRRSYAVPTGGSWSGPTLTAGSADAAEPATALTSSLRSGDYQIGANALDSEGFAAPITFYRDATFELAYTMLHDVAGRGARTFDRVGLPITSTVVSPAGFPAREFWQSDYLYDSRSAAPLIRSVVNTASDTNVTRNVELDATQIAGFGGGVATPATYNIVRDAGGRPTKVDTIFGGFPQTRVSFAANYAYRPDGRLASVGNGDGASLDFTATQTNSVVTPGPHAFTYDARGHVATETTFEGVYTFGYDEVGRNVRLEYPDGHVRTQTFDDLGRIVSRCYSNPAGGPDRCYGATYDPLGNPVRTTDPEGADNYVYDALDRVQRVTREVNGVTVATEEYAYNGLGALRTHAGEAVAHQRPRLDGAGNADAAVPASLGGQPITLDRGGRITDLRGSTFGWDLQGHMRQADGTRIGVDALGLRVETGEHQFLYEGGNLIADLEDMPLSAPRIPEGRLRATYLYGGIDHPLRRIEYTFVTRRDPFNNISGYAQAPDPTSVVYYEVDLTGNVRRLRGAGGTDLGGYRYSAFGKTLENTAAIDQPMRWKGRPREVFGAVEAYDMRARWWIPELGVFLSIDDYAFHDANTTLWGWPGQNPLRWSDPSGHYLLPRQLVDGRPRRLLDGDRCASRRLFPGRAMARRWPSRSRRGARTSP